MTEAPRPPTERVRIARLAPGFDAGCLSDQIIRLDLGEAKTLKATADGSVIRLTIPGIDGPAGIDAVLKTHPIGGARRTFQSKTGTTRGHRAFRAGVALAARGVRTAQPIALLTGLDRDKPVETLVTRAVEGNTLLQHIHDRESMDEAQRRTLATSVGAQLRLMLASGLYNRDHKPSNLLVDDGDQPVVVDTVAIRPAPLRTRALRRMLVSLGTEPLGIGVPVALRDAARCVRAAGGDTGLLRSVIDEILSKPDPRPTDDPLAGDA
ncbi:MAG: hypothetical protein AAGB51_10095 [Planctomycetota bacterium]